MQRKKKIKENEDPDSWSQTQSSSQSKDGRRPRVLTRFSKRGGNSKFYPISPWSMFRFLNLCNLPLRLQHGSPYVNTHFFPRRQAVYHALYTRNKGTQILDARAHSVAAFNLLNTDICNAARGIVHAPVITHAISLQGP